MLWEFFVLSASTGHSYFTGAGLKLGGTGSSPCEQSRGGRSELETLNPAARGPSRAPGATSLESNKWRGGAVDGESRYSRDQEVFGHALGRRAGLLGCPVQAQELDFVDPCGSLPTL